MEKVYRKGALGAVIDEYERAAEDLKKTIEGIDPDDFVRIIDKETEDPNCVSIQSVMNHVINAGYGYVFQIKKKFEDPEIVRIKCRLPENAEEACKELDQMISYTEGNLYKKYAENFESMLDEFKVPWGQNYDFEQMLEHAIVHVLRHRRQIEKFKLMIQNAE